MTPFECSCGWVEGADNGENLHLMHMRHVLDAERSKQEAAGFAQPRGPVPDLPAPPRRVSAPPSGPLALWLARDSFDHHVISQPRPFTRQDFPPGAQGLNWEVRTLEVDAQTWLSLLSGTYTEQQAETLLQQWWDDSPEGDVPWPA